MKKRHSAIFHNAWDEKRNFDWKSIFNRPETKKTKTFIEKAIRVSKTLQIQMKKGHSTVFHNAWGKKNTRSHWKINFQ